MDHDQILLQIKQQVFSSKLLSTREKWGVFQAIQQKNFDTAKLQEVLHAFKKEEQWIAEAEKSAQIAYLQDLQKWNEELDQIIHKEIPKQMRAVEAVDHAKDEAEADSILNEIL